MSRDRASQVWGKVIDQTGPAPDGAEFVHVLDRGADNFEVFCHLQDQRVHWVVRASQLHRNIITPSGEKTALNKYINALPVAGTYALKLRARPRQPARTAKLEVRYGRLSMSEPVLKSAYVKQRDGGPMTMSVVDVREVDAPPGVTPIAWVLYTSLTINNFEEARTIIGYYEKRWLIEEYHKALKTGCRVEARQLKSPQRLETMLGLMAVVAVRLLQLKSVARTQPQRPAQEVVPPLWIAMLLAVSKQPRRRELTVNQFYRELAKLGGFIGRKSDGQPGWITIWRGWEKLNLMIRGHNRLNERQPQRQNCG